MAELLAEQREQESPVVEEVAQSKEAEAALPGPRTAADPTAPLADPESILVDIDTVAGHPANPREQLGDLSELGAAIQEVGLLEPIVVASATAFLAAHPEYTEQIAAAEWVVLAGHRRTAAIREHTNLKKVRATRADRLANTDVDDLITLAIENLHRLDFSPIEEGTLFQAMLDRGLQQYEIVERVKKSKGHVSRRLKILNLVPELKAVLSSGRLRLEDALLYADKDPETQRAAWAYVDLNTAGGMGPAEAMALHSQHAERRQRTEEAQAKAAEAGVDIVDPEGMWGRQAASHRLVDDEAIEEARRGGTLAAALDKTGELYWVTTSSVEQPANALDDRAEAERAAKARAEACQSIVARRVTVAEALRRLTDAALAPIALGPAHRLAYGWLRSAGVGPDIANPAKYIAEVYTSTDTALRQLVATATALAVEEVLTREAKEWGPRQVAHVRRLTVEATPGYSPTAWEMGKMEPGTIETDEE
ncbi:ParB N-terminal domain-containing protein [Polymorphospora sp. NPDC050346]|uniref:ParB/RepB/Spo0J family partition protein n=1 Tax=Polymorphospora sp. NPDC050346 TaxID=3155780 RepID=UPI0033D0AD72